MAKRAAAKKAPAKAAVEETTKVVAPGAMAEKRVTVMLTVGGERRERTTALANAIRRLGEKCEDSGLAEVANAAAAWVDRYRV